MRRRVVGCGGLPGWRGWLAGARSEGEERALKGFLRRFAIGAITEDVAGAAVEIRRRHRIRLPDALIWAAARCQGALLVTRNSRDFPVDDPGVRIPYVLSRAT